MQDAFHDDHKCATGDASAQIQGGGGGVAGERTTSSLIIPSGELDQNAHSRSVTFDQLCSADGSRIARGVRPHNFD